jgi:cell division protein FtsN
MNNARHSVRDYKSPRHKPGLELGRWRDIGIGLGAGLVIALLVYVKEHRTAPTDATSAGAPVPRQDAVAAKTAAEPETPAAQYDFYDMLPKFEVVVPEKERDVRRDQPAVKIDKPGTYVLQAGSYRTPEDAERVRSQLGKQGVTASVQRVAVDADVWHRVRIGPLNNLEQLNRIRAQLRKSDIDALVIRLGD